MPILGTHGLNLYHCKDSPLGNSKGLAPLADTNGSTGNDGVLSSGCCGSSGSGHALYYARGLQISTRNRWDISSQELTNEETKLVGVLHNPS